MRVAIIGAGGIGYVHAKAWSLIPEVELLVLERKPDRQEKFTKEFGAKMIPNFEDALAQADAIDICLPTDQHYEIALVALEAKIPVLCEKPITRNLHEAIELRDAAAQNNTIFMPAQVARYFPEYRKAHDLIQSGAIGRPAVLRMQRGGKMPLGSELWFGNFARSGGVLLDLGIHEFDWLRWTFGEIDHVYSQSYGIARGGGNDYSLTILQLKSGAIAHVESSWMEVDGFKTSFELAGSEGLISHVYRESASLKITHADGCSYENSMLPNDDPFALEIADFKSIVEGKVAQTVTPDDGCWAIAIAMAAIQSAQSGDRVVPTLDGF